MDRNQLVLAVLASAGGRSLTPAQLQKSIFLITQNIPNIITKEPGFNFVAYDYGPFDKHVYDSASALKAQELVEFIAA